MQGRIGGIREADYKLIADGGGGLIANGAEKKLIEQNKD